jgi:outer membrane receptor for Fe3+-dicitrate
MLVASLLPALVLTAATATPEVVIEATRTRVAAFDYPGSATTVSNEELGLLAATHASEAINRVPGAFLQRGSGQEVLVALRSPVLAGPGACGAFLVMEDGLPLRPVGSCNVNELFEVNLEQAAGLEVVRGLPLAPAHMELAREAQQFLELCTLLRSPNHWRGGHSPGSPAHQSQE